MQGLLFIALQAAAAISSLVTSGYAVQAMANPRLITRGKASPGVRMLAFLAAARSVFITAATLGAILLQQNEALIWLAGVGVAMQFLDSIHGQVQNDAARTLAPLGIGCVLLLVLILFLTTRNAHP
jgi:hypothetical protein